MSELTKALCAFHQQVGTIHKDAKAQYGKYADLAGVLSTVLPILSKNGLAISQTFDAERNLITTLTHTSGETQSSILPMIVPQGRNELHSWGASVTYMRRYAICSILCLVADIDTDGNLEEPASVPSAGSSAPKPKPKAAPKAEPAPVADADQPLSKEQREEVVQAILATPKEYVATLCKAFADEFKTGNAKISSKIQAKKHYDWIQAYFADNPL